MSNKGWFGGESVFFYLVHVFVQFVPKAKQVPKNLYFHTFLCFLNILNILNCVLVTKKKLSV